MLLFRIYETCVVDSISSNFPYAMAFKRCFDRVVLKKSKLAYSGIYSEVEADEFKQKEQEESTTSEKEKQKGVWEKVLRRRR